jgi:hypothetical protein
MLLRKLEIELAVPGLVSMARIVEAHDRRCHRRLGGDRAQLGWRCDSAARCAPATSPARMAATSSLWTLSRCSM